MPSEKNKILTFKQYMQSEKMPYITYADLECLIEKIDGCENNPEYSPTTKIGKYFPCGYSLSTIWGFDHIKNKHSLYFGKDCMKEFRKSLKEHAKSMIEFERRKMLPLIPKELKPHKEAN